MYSPAWPNLEAGAIELKSRLETMLGTNESVKVDQA